jgi:hypothetical protein
LRSNSLIRRLKNGGPDFGAFKRARLKSTGVDKDWSMPCGRPWLTEDITAGDMSETFCERGKLCLKSSSFFI